MPELPEVETTCRGISPHIIDSRIHKVALRNSNLRWPVLKSIVKTLSGLLVVSVQRRGKYILINLETGCLIIHLGMSGSLRIVTVGTAPEKHDHFDLCLNTGRVLRYRDPRRFGSIHWTTTDPGFHPLLRNLGPEPLTRSFTGSYLFKKSRNKTRAIKTFIMDGCIVAGIGNIYANEALFDSGILPSKRAGKLSKKQYENLVFSIKKILKKSILKGGSTLRDFVGGDGEPGYFQQTLSIYGRAGMPCKTCQRPLQSKVLNQRATYYCNFCQH